MRCSSCGAILDRFDRYCQACDAPNLQGKLFPKFRSHLVDLELAGHFARPARPPLKAGERPCPRCDTTVSHGEQWCPACGLDLDVVRPAKPVDPLQGVWRTPGPNNLDPYRPLRVVGATFRLALMLAAATFGGTAILYLLWYLRLDPQLPDVAVDLAMVSTWVGRLTLVGALASVVALVGAVAWTNRAYRNLPALGVKGLRFSPEIVGAAWLVPGVNVVVPKLVLDELWRGSDPMTRSGTKRWRRQEAPTAAHVGWIALCAGIPAAALVAFAAPLQEATSVSDVRLRLLLGVAANGCLLLATASLAVVVRQINERQAERAGRLGPAEIPPLSERREAASGAAGARGAARPAAMARADLGFFDGGPSPLRPMVPGHAVSGRY